MTDDGRQPEPDINEMRAELARGGVLYPQTDDEVRAAYSSIIEGRQTDDDDPKA